MQSAQQDRAAAAPAHKAELPAAATALVEQAVRDAQQEEEQAADQLFQLQMAMQARGGCGGAAGGGGIVGSSPQQWQSLASIALDESVAASARETSLVTPLATAEFNLPVFGSIVQRH